jgi:uncharacterized membrane protein YbhN (UPF0104 family)
VLIAAGLVAFGLAGLRLFRPIDNPGVEECGAPVVYVVEDVEPVPTPLPADAPFDAEPLANCRDLSWDEVEKGLLAGGVAVGVLLLAALLGLVDDRWMLARATRFEDLLRRRPKDAPIKLRAGTGARALDEGRGLPKLDVVDLGYLALGLVVTVLLLRAAAETEALAAAYEAASWGSLVLAALLGAGMQVAAGAQLAWALPGLGVVEGLRVTVATAFRGEASPDLGPFGLVAHELVRRGRSRAEAQAAIVAQSVVSGLVHLAFLVLLVLPADILLAFREVPPRWWFLVVLAFVSVTAGFWRGLSPGGRLLRTPRTGDVGAFWGRLTAAPAEEAGALGATIVLALLPGLVLAACASFAGADLPLTTALGLALLAAAVGALAPMPGGVGVVEPVLVWGLAGTGVGLAPAALAVLAFRGLTYWLPLLVGIAVARSSPVEPATDDPGRSTTS